MIKKLVFVFTVFIIFQSKTWADCTGLTISAGNITTVWDTTWTTQSVSVTVNKTDPGACTFGLGFSKGGAGSYTRFASDGAKQLTYQLYQDSGKTKVLKDVPDTVTVNDVIMVTLPPGNNPQIAQYFFDIPFASATTPVMAAATSYIDNFSINAYEGADPSAFSVLPNATAPVVLTVDISPLISISLVDAGGGFQPASTTKTISFGNTYHGQTSRFDMLIRTNAGLNVTMVSSNAGRLKHISKNAYVPYSISVNNVVADLTGVAPVINNGGQTTMSGLAYPIKVVMGVIPTAAVSGSYQDSVTITAVTIE